MKNKLLLMTVITTVLMLGSVANIPVFAQNAPPMHEVGEKYIYEMDANSFYSDMYSSDVYDENNTLVYTEDSNYDTSYLNYGVFNLTFLGPEYTGLIDQYYQPDYMNYSVSPDQVMYDRVYTYQEMMMSTEGSYNNSYYAWDLGMGVIADYNDSDSWGPETFWDKALFDVLYNSTYGMLFEEMFYDIGPYNDSVYIDFLNRNYDFTVYTERTVSNTVMEYTINGGTSQYSVILVNVTSYADLNIAENATIYLGDMWNPSTPSGIFEVSVNVSVYHSSLFYYDAVDGRLLEFNVGRDSRAQVGIDDTAEVYFPDYNATDYNSTGYYYNTTGFYQNVTVSAYGESVSGLTNQLLLVNYSPAPIPEGTNRLMKGDKLVYNTYSAENKTFYGESYWGGNTSWWQEDVSGESYGTATVEVVYHDQGGFVAFTYGESYGAYTSTYTDAWGSYTNTWDVSDTFFDFTDYMMNSPERDIIVDHPDMYFMRDVPYNFAMPVVGSEVSTDTFNMFINGYNYTINAEVTTTFYSYSYQGYESGMGGVPPVSVDQFNNSDNVWVNFTGAAAIMSFVDLDTGAFVGQAEISWYSLEQTYEYMDMNGTYYTDSYNYMHMESIDVFSLSEHPYLYQSPQNTTTSDTSTNDTTSDVTNTSETVVNSTTTTSDSGNDTSSVAPPTNPLPGFEFAVTALAFTGILIINKKRR